MRQSAVAMSEAPDRLVIDIPSLSARQPVPDPGAVIDGELRVIWHVKLANSP